MMKRILILLTSLLTMSAQAQTHDWENPAVLGINKLPYHATLQLPSKWKACKEIISLDGEWLFRWSRNPEERQTPISSIPSSATVPVLPVNRQGTGQLTRTVILWDSMSLSST